MSIKENIIALELPSNVHLVVAAKGRSPEQVREAINAGAKIIGENYVQESLDLMDALGTDSERVDWHFIGHLQSNKVRKVVSTHDLIQTVDSLKLGKKIDACCEREGKTMPVFIEVNSAGEPEKHGVMPEDAEALASELLLLDNLSLQGIMTMGPREGFLPAFKKTRELFLALKTHDPQVTYLSMGMSRSYSEAIVHGANMVRIGSRIFDNQM